jgi:DNA-binding NtrC family response regulator
MFLDEIGEMSCALQAKLLQVLQDGEFSRIGGKHDVRVDVRIVAATNKNLEHAVADAQFREDLFFRLNVVCIKMPALRDRREDIPVLCDYFLKKYSVHYNKPYCELSAETLALLQEYEWPGNIRELENLVKRTVVLGTESAMRKELMHGVALATHPPMPPVPGPSVSARRVETGPAEPVQAPAPANYSLKDVSRSAARGAERDLISRMLLQTRWNRKEAADMLGISYKALLYKIKENGLDKAQ